MKVIFNSLVLLLSITILSSCGSPKSIQSVTGAEEISLPFSEGKYKSDKESFRARQSGKSPDLGTSKKIALQNAKSELAANIKSVFKNVTSQYTYQRSVGDAQEYENKFE